MDVRIAANLSFTVTGTGLEDALAEFDELTVTGLIKEVLDKAIDCDDIQIAITEGPNTLEEYDSVSGGGEG
ncbi:MAG: hypothetical protein QNK05_01965 [Myxococcota bacterium]|nr:hypothetical protein [Myxococcota bacterium]